SARGGLVEPRNDLEDGGLAGAVGADHADLRARVEAHGHVIEDDLVAHGLAGLVHGVDKFRHAVPPGQTVEGPARAPSVRAVKQSMARPLREQWRAWATPR